MKRSALLLVAMFAGGLLTDASAQGMRATAPPPSAPLGKVTAAAVWTPSEDILNKARNFCDKSMGAASFPECFMNQLAAAGAPAESTAFTRALYQQSDGQVGVISAIKNHGAIGVAQVMYPLRANDNYGLLFVNTHPNLLDPDDLKKLDESALNQDAAFQSMKKRYPQADIWPGDRSGKAPWPLAKALPDGGTEFIVSYPLINGCHACERAGKVRFGWNFDATGKFVKTVYIDTTGQQKGVTKSSAGKPSQQ